MFEVPEWLANRNLASWSDVAKHFRDSLTYSPDSYFLEGELRLIDRLAQRGLTRSFRAGTSLDWLMISTALRYGLNDGDPSIVFFPLTKVKQFHLIYHPGGKAADLESRCDEIAMDQYLNVFLAKLWEATRHPPLDSRLEFGEEVSCLGGRVSFCFDTIVNDAKELVSIGRAGKLSITGPNGEELDSISVRDETILLVKEGEVVSPWQKLRWNPTDPSRFFIRAEHEGRVRFVDLVEGATFSIEKNAGGVARRCILEAPMVTVGQLLPRLIIENENGQAVEDRYLPEKTRLEIGEGQMVSRHDVLATCPRE